MVLFGLMSGRSTGTRLAAFSKFSLKICVTICPPAGARPDGPWVTATVAACSLASASGTTLYRPADSTTVKPCRRSAARNCSKALAGETARSVTRLSWPLTRGSTTTLRPVMVARVRATASMSAPEKFSVTGSLGSTLPVCADVCLDVCAAVCA